MTRRILFAYPYASPLCSTSGISTFVFETSHLLAQLGQWEVDILTDLSFSCDGASCDPATATARLGDSGIRLHYITRDDGIPYAWGSPVIHRAERFYRAMKQLHAQHCYDVSNARIILLLHFSSSATNGRAWDLPPRNSSLTFTVLQKRSLFMAAAELSQPRRRLC